MEWADATGQALGGAGKLGIPLSSPKSVGRAPGQGTPTQAPCAQAVPVYVGAFKSLPDGT